MAGSAFPNTREIPTLFSPTWNDSSVFGVPERCLPRRIRATAAKVCNSAIAAGQQSQFQQCKGPLCRTMAHLQRPARFSWSADQHDRPVLAKVVTRSSTAGRKPSNHTPIRYRARGGNLLRIQCECGAVGSGSPPACGEGPSYRRAGSGCPQHGWAPRPPAADAGG